MDLKKVTLVLIVLTTFICGCKKKTDTAIAPAGTSPNDYLAADPFSKLEIEIGYDKGFPPSGETIDNIKSFLAAHINKPAGIEVFLKEVGTPVKERMSLGDIKNAEKQNRTAVTSGNTLSLFIYLANAEYEEAAADYKTLGIQYGPGSIVLFGRSIRASSGGIGQPPYPVLETSVTLHEFGHILGLVNAGTGMTQSHEDNQHSHHCNNKECLMYFAVETSNLVANILGGKVPALDATCNNDLKGNGGK